MSVDEFAALPDDDGVKRELIDGEVYEMASGGRVHETVKGNVNLEFAAWVKIQKFNARVQSETRYYLPDIVCQPDVSVVLGNSLGTSESRITITPDLAVEVVSSETAQHLNRKIKALLSAGTKAVVAIYPPEREVHIFRTSGIELIPESGTLRVEDVLPGFAIPVASLFDGL